MLNAYLIKWLPTFTKLLWQDSGLISGLPNSDSMGPYSFHSVSFYYRAISICSTSLISTKFFSLSHTKHWESERHILQGDKGAILLERLGRWTCVMTTIGEVRWWVGWLRGGSSGKRRGGFFLYWAGAAHSAKPTPGFWNSLSLCLSIVALCLDLPSNSKTTRPPLVQSGKTAMVRVRDKRTRCKRWTQTLGRRNKGVQQLIAERKHPCCALDSNAVS